MIAICLIDKRGAQHQLEVADCHGDSSVFYWAYPRVILRADGMRYDDSARRFERLNIAGDMPTFLETDNGKD